MLLILGSLQITDQNQKAFLLQHSSGLYTHIYFLSLLAPRPPSSTAKFTLLRDGKLTKTIHWETTAKRGNLRQGTRQKTFPNGSQGNATAQSVSEIPLPYSQQQYELLLQQATGHPDQPRRCPSLLPCSATSWHSASTFREALLAPRTLQPVTGSCRYVLLIFTFLS